MSNNVGGRNTLVRWGARNARGGMFKSMGNGGKGLTWGGRGTLFWSNLRPDGRSNLAGAGSVIHPRKVWVRNTSYAEKTFWRKVLSSGGCQAGAQNRCRAKNPD